MVLITDSSSIDLSLTNIWHAWLAFNSGKKPSRDILLFEGDLENNLLWLCAELNNDTYAHGGYGHRIVNKKKRRDIAVSNVRDRIVHRLLYDYMVPIVDKTLDPDVWSCRPNKGLHKALNRTVLICNRYEGKYVWRADITKFFDNVDHEVLLACLYRKIADVRARKLLDKVVDSYSLQLEASKQASKQARLTYWQFNQSNFCQHIPERIRQMCKKYG